MTRVVFLVFFLVTYWFIKLPQKSLLALGISAFFFMVCILRTCSSTEILHAEVLGARCTLRAGEAVRAGAGHHRTAVSPGAT